MVQGCILLIAVTYVTVNLLTDLVYGSPIRGSATNEPADRGSRSWSLARAWRRVFGAVARAVPIRGRRNWRSGSRARRWRIRSASTNWAATSWPRLVAGARISLLVGVVGGVGVRDRRAWWSAASPGYCGGWADS